MGYWRDPDFQEKLVTYLCRDRNFLRRTAGILSAHDFRPRKGQSPELQIVASKALDYWRKYGEPIGGMLRPEMTELADERKMGNRQRERLMEIVSNVRNGNGLVAVGALEEKVIAYKSRQAKHEAIEELIDLQEKHQLTDERFRKIFERATKGFSAEHDVIDIAGGLEQRIARRELNSTRKYPYLMIECLDKTVHVPPRGGGIGLILGKYKVGKSLIFIHLGQTMALQGLNVLHFTLEDPRDTVEDRYDAALAGLTISRLNMLPNKLRHRFTRAMDKLRGRIRVVDGTKDGLSIEAMDSIYEQQRNRGFPADVILIDYDEYIVPTEHYKTDSGRRRELGEIYQALRHWGGRRDVYLWTAAQTRRGKKGNPVKVVGDDAAEDISKVRKAYLCLGVGFFPDWGDNGRFITVAANKDGEQFMGYPIMGDFKRGIFYDAVATAKRQATWKEEKKKKREEE